MKQNINYISHLNNVNHKLYDTEVNSSHIALYNALFQLWNNCGFEDELSINRNDVMKLSKIGSVNTYLKCLKELDKLEFIKYKPSKNPLKGSVINMFRFDTSSDIVLNKFSTSYDTSSDNSTDTSSDTLSKLSNQLNYKTIKLLNNNISTINLNLEDFNLNLENFFSEHSNNIPENFEKEKSSAQKEKFNFKTNLIKYGFDEKLVDDWLEVRKNKKATNSETAFNSFINEIESKKCNINEMLQISVTNSWAGFKHQWVENIKKQDQNQQSDNSHRTSAVNAVNALFGIGNKEMHHNR